MAWTTRAPAKVNLDLRMRGLRTDGYHLLRTVLQSIALADQLTLRARTGPFAIECDTPGVPTDERNLAWKGAAAMARALGVSLDGWHLRLDKQVPAESGLGGGSADAAAAARLVAAAAGASFDAVKLADVIRPLGADVAFFAHGGTMLGEGIGDQLTPVPDEPDAVVVLVRPPFGVSTRDAYRWFDETLNAERRTQNAGRSDPNADLSAEALAKAERRTPGAPKPHGESMPSFGNDLEGPVAARHPEIRQIVERLLDAGAAHAAMTGSGSACFGLFDPTAIVDALERDWPAGTQVWVTRSLSRAAYVDLTCVTTLR